MGYKEACEKCKLHYEKAKQHPNFLILFGIMLAVILLIWPHSLRVPGGIALGIIFNYTYKCISATKKSIIIAQESQITEHFTRAVDQLGAIDQNGSKKIEIRLEGIYALERISNESEKDYWPIMEILTAYVRKNSSAEIFRNKIITHQAMGIQANECTTSEVPEVSKVSLDIQAILTVIGRRKKSFKNGEPNRLDLRETNIQKAELSETHFEGADLSKAHLEKSKLLIAHLEGADLSKAHLEKAKLLIAHFEEADLSKACLEGANLMGTHLEGADLMGTYLEGADLMGTHLEGANLMGTHLEGANLVGTHLEGAKRLTIDQLSKAKTLYKATGFDKELEISLREKYPALFEKPNDNES